MSTWGHGPEQWPPVWPPSSSTLAPSPLCPQIRISSHHCLLLALSYSPVQLKEISKPFTWQTGVHVTLVHFFIPLGDIPPSPTSLQPQGLFSCLQSDHPYLGVPPPPRARSLIWASRGCTFSSFRSCSRAHPLPNEPRLIPPRCAGPHPPHIPLPHCTCSFSPSHVAPTALIHLFYACLMNASHSQQIESSREAKPRPVFIHSCPLVPGRYSVTVFRMAEL